MRKTNCLLFIPQNPKFFDFTKTKGGDIALLTLEEKIKRNPTQRERLRCEAKFGGGANPSKKKFRKQRTSTGPPSSVPEAISLVDSQPFSGGDFNQYDDDKILYLKNMTETEIILDFNISGPVELGENKRPLRKAKVIKHFLPIWELSEEELHSPVLEGYYRRKMITGVTEAQYHREMAVIKSREQQEASVLDSKRRAAAQDRAANPHRDRAGLRRIGAGGVEMNIMGGDIDDISGLSQTAQTGDGGTISFDLGPDAGFVNPSTIRSELEDLASLIPPSIEEVPYGGVSAGDMSSMFSTGEFNTTKS